MAEDRQSKIKSLRRLGNKGKTDTFIFSPKRVASIMVLGAALIFGLVILVRDGHRLLTYPFSLNPWLVLLSFIIECGGLLLAVFVWHEILAQFGSPLTRSDDLRIYSYSMLGIILPGGIWSTVSRATLYEQRGVAGLGVAAASIIEFILLGLAGMLVYGVTIIVRPIGNVWQRPEVAVMIIVVSLLLLQPFLFNRLVSWLLRRFQHVDKPRVSLSYLDLARWLLLESFVVILGGIAVYVLLRSFTTVPVDFVIQVISAWSVAVITGNLFFWLPGTFVIRDGAMVLILSQSLPTSVTILFVLLVRIWTIVSILVVIVLTWGFLGKNRQFRVR